MSRRNSELVMQPPPPPNDVDRVIRRYEPATRAGVLALRDLIYLGSANLPQIGTLQEALRWGQPAYLTSKRAGSTLRLGPHRDAAFAIFAHCQSTIISSYAQAFPGWDRIDGNRAILFDSPDQIEPERLSHLIRHALTYHLSDAA